MFKLNEFIMTGLRGAVGKMEDYQIILNSAGWKDKGILSIENLAELQQLIEDKNAKKSEVTE